MKQLKDRIAFVKEVMKWSNAELARQAHVSRTAPTDWLNGSVGVLSSPVAQNLSQRTPFTATWLATGDKPMYKAEQEIPAHKVNVWPFSSIDEVKVRELDDKPLAQLEAAILIAAGQVGLDVKKKI